MLVSKPGHPNVVDPGKATALFKLLKRQAGELFDLRETHARTNAAADALRESGRAPLLDQLAERIVEGKYEAAHIFWQKLACALYNMSMPPNRFSYNHRSFVANKKHQNRLMDQLVVAVRGVG